MALREGRRSRAYKARYNVTDLRLNISAHTEVTATFKVDKKLVECAGPSGRCYVVEMERKIRSKDESGRESFSRYRNVYLIDLSGVVVQARIYNLRTPGSSALEINLVEWR